MSYTLQLLSAIVESAKMYASSCGITLNRLVQLYVVEFSTRKPTMKKRRLGIAEGECRIPTAEEDRMMDEEIANAFGSAADEVSFELPVRSRHGVDIANLTDIHGDPFDRMLITQARSDGLKLISHDDKVIAYGESIVRV